MPSKLPVFRLPIEHLGSSGAARWQSSSGIGRVVTCLPQRSRIPYKQTFSTTYRQQTAETPGSSVSEDEVGHFSKLAASWWDPHGSSRLLHLMNPLRHDFIKSCLQSNSQTSYEKLSYLDVGCGGGIFATSAARLPTTASVTAIDPTPKVIAVAKTKQRSDPALSEPKLRYLQCSIEELDIPKASIDILACFEVLEHVSNPYEFLQMCLPYVKPGGWVVGSTIARSPLSFLTTKVIAEAPIIGVVPRGTHDWKKYINPEELQEWFACRPELSQVMTQGVIYVPALGWKFVNGSEKYGNYFFGVRVS